MDGIDESLRLHGVCRVHQMADPSFTELLDRFQGTDISPEGIRSIISIDVNRVADSCGYSVPLMSFEGWRPHRDLWIDKKLRQFGPGAIKRYILDKNVTSLDGLPAIDPDSLT